MTASYSVIVRNASQSALYFYIVQKAASFDGVLAAITCSSLGCAQIGNYDATGSQIDFSLDVQVYAGAVSTAQAFQSVQAWALLRSPMRNMSTTSSAIRPVAVTAQSGVPPPNFTTMSLNPLGLSPATNAASVSAGSFCIRVPSYVPSPTPTLFCGNAVALDNGIVVLSSSVTPPPYSDLLCEPYSIYYVKVGNLPPGTQVHGDPTQSAYAECDFTTGNRTIVVQYDADGTFSIVSSS